VQIGPERSALIYLVALVIPFRNWENRNKSEWA